MTAPGELSRRLRTPDAVVIGLGSMIGAGVFAAFTPAAAAAGNGLLIGLVVAGVVALGNAMSSAVLAARFPTSGGTYAYGREVLGAWWGFVAGWSFVIGKIASCAAMALTFAAYAAPEGWSRVVAIAAVVALAIVNYRGITKTAAVTKVLVALVVVALVVAVSAILLGPTASWSLDQSDLLASGPYGVLQSAGLLFFAFAGYARIATLGEEVVDPRRTIPRAIVIAFGIVVIVYGGIAVTLLGTLGAAGVAESADPLARAVAASGASWADPVVRVGAALASLGALVSLLAGIGRTMLAMARRGDLPRWLGAVHPRFAVPHRADVAMTVVIVAIIALADVRGAIAFSSFGVLLYYFVANVAAFRLDATGKGARRAFAVVGGVGCCVLVVTLPPAAVIAGVLVVVIGVVGRLATGRRRS
ncbi:APC family permease [Marisediminicola sp. LYQ85]|uniref:APC family permease n=1 Tax=Marisediminicola sp. LYQ85 TaxID=3391062 RepID=UPI0039838A2A